MKMTLCFTIILVICAASLPAGVAYAQDRDMPLIAEKAVVLFTQGDVMVESKRATKWIDATVGMTVERGESLRTGPKSWAEIGVVSDRENIFRVQEKTLVRLIDLRPIRISLLNGEVRSLVEALPKDSTFEIETPTAVCGARGTGWDTKTNGKNLTADAFESSIFIRPIVPGGGTGNEFTLGQGKRGALKDPADSLKIREIPAGKMRDWNRWKEDFIDRRAGGERDRKEMDKRVDAGTGNARQNIDKIQEKVEQADRARGTAAEGNIRGQESRADKRDLDSATNRIEETPHENTSTY